MVVQLYIDGLQPSLSEATLQDVLRQCCGNKFESWIRIKSNDGALAGSGFLRLIDYESAAVVMKIMEGSDMTIIPDSSFSNVCQAEFENTTVNDEFKNEILKQLEEDPLKVLEQDIEDGTPMESQIQSRLRLGPRQDYMSDEFWEDLKAFRYTQAKNEVLEDQERERIVYSLMEKLKTSRIRVVQEAPQVKVQEPQVVVVKEHVKPTIVEATAVPQLEEMAIKLDIKPKRQVIEVEDDEDDDENQGKKRKLVPIEFSNTSEKNARDVKANIAKHVETHLGESESSLVDFVFELVGKNKTREDMKSELEDVFDEDTDKFIDAIMQAQ